MQFPHTLFKAAGLNSTDVALLFGVSRVTGYRWLSGTDRHGGDGVGINIFLQERVAKMVPIIERAIESGTLPNHEMIKLPPSERFATLKSVLKDQEKN